MIIVMTIIIINLHRHLGKSNQLQECKDCDSKNLSISIKKISLMLNMHEYEGIKKNNGVGNKMFR